MKRDKGKLLAAKLIPDLRLVADGSPDDLRGIDAYWGECKVQVKFDTRISDSRNVWHEIYEKSQGREDQPWRAAYGAADFYLFITETPTDYWGFLVGLDAVAEAEKGRTLILINVKGQGKTSLGFLIPTDILKPEMVKISKLPKPVSF